MLDLGDHAAGLRGIRQLGDAPDPVEAEPDQRLALGMMAPDRAAGLFDLDHFLALAHIGLSGSLVTLSRRPARTRRRRTGAPPGRSECHTSQLTASRNLSCRELPRNT